MIRLPDDSRRHTIIGRTGSGKTQFAVNSLLYRSIDLMPWVILNFKEDILINEIPGATHLGAAELPPDAAPGIYIVHPAPDDYDSLEDLFRELWTRQNCGLFVDEAYMLNPPGRPSAWFRRLLTQGRSRSVPVILCTQRASWVDRFVFSESDFFSIFALSDKREVATVHNFVNESMTMEGLPAYHSWYYDVSDDSLTVLKPVPPADEILAEFEARIPVPEIEIVIKQPPRMVFL